MEEDAKAAWHKKGPLTSEAMLAISKTLNDPIQCGYFLLFCKMEYSVENILFIMEVDRYMDALFADKKCWQYNWAELDSKIFRNDKSAELVSADDPEYRSLVEEKLWPSKVVQRRFVDARIQEIFDTFMSRTAPYEICISHETFMRTKVRADLVHIYGPGVFNEAMHDALVTLRDDALPRFRHSDMYHEMEARIAFCAKLPAADTLDVSPPLSSQSPLLKEGIEQFPDSRMFELREIMADSFLYSEFLSYLKKTFASENLLCARKIAEFEDYFPPPLTAAPSVSISASSSSSSLVATAAGSPPAHSLVSGDPHYASFMTRRERRSSLPTRLTKTLARSRKDITIPEDAVNCAWTIYRYFVAHGAAYEIHLSVRQCKDIMIGLSQPERDLFEVLKKTVMGTLATNFSSYKFTPEYAELSKNYRAHREQMAKHSRAYNYRNCLF